MAIYEHNNKHIIKTRQTRDPKFQYIFFLIYFHTIAFQPPFSLVLVFLPYRRFITILPKTGSVVVEKNLTEYEQWTTTDTNP